MPERVKLGAAPSGAVKPDRVSNAIPRRARGRPFKQGNPGRPRGSKNKVTQIAEQLAECQAQELIQTVLDLARAGDVACLRMLLDRLWPLRKGQPINVNMPPIKASQDVLAALASIWEAIREGCLTPDEASALSGLMDRSIRVIELQDFENRIKSLELSRDQQHEKKLPTATGKS